MSEPAAFRFPHTFVHLGEHDAVPLEVTESFWPDLMSGKLAHLGPGRLVSYYHFTEDWDAWERHPAGDELVVLVSGAVDFVLELPEGHRTLELRGPGAFVIVPAGAWHTARVREPSVGLFVTDGEGTEHRPA